MAQVLDRKYTTKDSTWDILRAIRKLAADKNHRILMEDDNKWLETKLREIKRLVSIVLKRRIRAGRKEKV